MLFGKFQDVTQAAANVALDPCLMTVANQLNTLAEIESSSTPSSPTQASIGIGLCKAVGPINALIFLRRNPIVGFLLGAAVIGGIFGVGMKYGRRHPA